MREHPYHTPPHADTLAREMPSNSERAPGAPPEDAAARRHPAFVAVVAAYAAGMIAWTVLRYRHFGSGVDLAAYHSVFWNLARRGTPYNAIERVHQWSNHLELGLAWLAIPYRLYATPVWLLIAQTLAVAGAAFPIEAIARRITHDRLISALAALAMLLTPQLVLADLADFHAATICVLPVAILAWGIEVDSSRAVALSALAAVSLREQMGLLLVAAGLAWAIRHGRRRVFPGALLAIGGLVCFFVAVKWAIPAFGSGQSFRYMAQYNRLGGTADGVLSTATKGPFAFLAMALHGDRKVFALELASGSLPLLFLSLRSIRRAAWPLLLAAPLLAVQLYSDDPAKWSIHTHYGAPLVPLFATAAILALALLPAKGDIRTVVAAVWLSMILMHDTQALPSLRGPGGAITSGFSKSPRGLALWRAIAAVPPKASISAQEDVVAHVASRVDVHAFPDGEDSDQYILLDRDGAALHPEHLQATDEAIARFHSSADFKVLVDQAGVLLVKRVDARRDGPPAREQGVAEPPP
jgi:uncharacterized membrane protein